jgi:hypothetical protein
MNNLDTDSRADAARSYLRLRRLYWRWSLLGGPTIVAVASITHAAFGAVISPDVLRAFDFAIYFLFLAAGIVWMLGFAAMGYVLSRFRCPSCGGRVAMGWVSFWPGRRCKHCRLDLGQLAEPGAKPLADGELWE